MTEQLRESGDTDRHATPPDWWWSDLAARARIADLDGAPLIEGALLRVTQRLRDQGR